MHESLRAIRSIGLTALSIGGGLALITALVLLAGTSGSAPRVSAVGENSITTPDIGPPFTGLYTSLELDSSGYPVIAQVDSLFLNIVHCNDANCDGNDESITAPVGGVVQDTSLVLDASGFPVVSFFDQSVGRLQVLRCNDVNCAGGDESVTQPDPIGAANQQFTSLALDSSGYPVVSYYNSSTQRMRVVHCNDAYCVGLNESIEEPAGGLYDVGATGRPTSLMLAADGSPTVVYGRYNGGAGGVVVVNCNDANCDGGDETVELVDSSNGMYISARLDSSGNPVIAYTQESNLDLAVMHCNDASCAGSDESINTPDTSGNVGQHVSLRLDASGYPVASYEDTTNTDLRVMHCSDADCDSSTITTVDSTDMVGRYTSLQLDSLGYPVVSYHDYSNGALKVLHCGTVTCIPPPPTPTNTATPTDTATPEPTPTPCPGGDPDCDGFQDTPQTLHRGPANTDVNRDNCPGVANSSQANTDGNFRDNSPPYTTSVDDRTFGRSDDDGDACDTDDDNDGVVDWFEVAFPLPPELQSLCPGTTAPIDPLLFDTDGDRFHDGAECVLGTDANSDASRPTSAMCAAYFGVTTSTDTDGDKIRDHIEACHYNSDRTQPDSDGDKALDGAVDGCEVASLNGDRIVNVADMGMLASAIANLSFRIVNMDLNKDGAWNVADQGLLASFISPAGQCPG